MTLEVQVVARDVTIKVMANENGDSSKGADQFATTHWSMIISAGRKSSLESKRALESLCAIYWCPLYAYARRRVSDANEAQDLTQAFFAELLEKNYVGTAIPDRGRFRAFLLTAFKHFMSKQWQKSKAQKRGGDRTHLSLNFDSADSSLQIEPSSYLTPEQIYDQQWAIAMLARTLERLQGEMERTGRENLFNELKGFIVGNTTGATYAQVSQKLGMSEAAAKKAASRLRRRYQELLRDEISQTVSDPEEIEDEIRNLFTTLSL